MLSILCFENEVNGIALALRSKLGSVDENIHQLKNNRVCLHFNDGLSPCLFYK